jgi:hypothetical protein
MLITFKIRKKDLDKIPTNNNGSEYEFGRPKK